MSYDSNYNEYDTFLTDTLGAGFILAVFFITLVLLVIAYVVTALIYFKASKTNGFSDVAYIAWIPIANIYSLFILTAKGHDDLAVRAEAKKNTLIYFGLFIVSLIPLIGLIASLALLVFTFYFVYRLLYRWSGETGKAILYLILSIISGGIAFIIYGLMRMNRPFKAA
ncbi:hypothetical protein [Lysinibacillus sp. 54212]|uniref:hypothetical protein n=1 Tax=Lysinibacillus sp. 54212 TaxID=3119829 RepID=UPI002FC91FD6